MVRLGKISGLTPLFIYAIPLAIKMAGQRPLIEPNNEI